MKTMAVVLEKPEHIGFNRLELTPPGIADVVVDIHYSGISTGTEKLLSVFRRSCISQPLACFA